MLDFYDHALAALLILALPPRAWLAFRTLVRAAPERRPRLRERLYLIATFTQWSLVTFVVVRWLRTGRGWAEIGLVPVLTPGAIGVAIGLAIIATLVGLQARRGVSDPETQARMRGRLAHVEPLMPHSSGELARFRVIAITAGICEELLFRGFLIWYFMHFVGLIPAAGLASVSFGIGHAYQGPRYVVVTGLLGAFLGAVYLITGSLFLPMLIHALMDLYSGWVAYRLFAPAVEAGAGASLPPAEPAA